MSKRDLILKVFLPIVLLAIGVGGTMALIGLRQAPQPEEKPFLGPLVNVVAVTEEQRQVVVKGTGTVQARYQAEVTPQVSGQIDSISSNMVAGGFFQQGDTLFTIEAIDFQLALDQAQSNLAQAELDLIRIRNQASIAREEWQRLGLENQQEPNPLVLYEPQMKSAEAVLASARAAVKQAELNLSRTRITAPFNCYVRSEQVDLGQYVRVGTPVATLVGTDAVEIVVPLPLEELAWIQIPDTQDSTNGSLATVTMQLSDGELAWQGRIVRTLGDIDAQNRMASVVVAVRDPFRQQQALELTPGMFVEVLLHGRDLGTVVPLPRGALRDNDTVWVVDENNRLVIRAVEIVRKERQEVMVNNGLAQGDRVVLSGLTAAANGMLLRPQTGEAGR